MVRFDPVADRYNAFWVAPLDAIVDAVGAQWWLRYWILARESA